MDDDCYLPFARRTVSPLAREARLDPALESLRDGFDRPAEGVDHGAALLPGEAVQYLFDAPQYVENVRIVFDSDLNRRLMGILPQRNLPANRPLSMPEARMPETLVKAYRIEATLESGDMIIVADKANNRRRMRRHSVGASVTAIRLIPTKTWGAESCHIFSFDMK
jgi:hypothetical protein